VEDYRTGSYTYDNDAVTTNLYLGNINPKVYSFLGIMNVGLSLRKTYRSQVFDRNFCVNVTLHMPCDSGLWLMLLLILLLKPVKTPQLKYTSPDGLQLICFLYSVNVNLVVLNVSSKHLGWCSNSQVRTVC